MEIPVFLPPEFIQNGHEDMLTKAIIEACETEQDKKKARIDLLISQAAITKNIDELPDPVPIVFSPLEPEKAIFYKSTLNCITGKGKSRKTSFLIGLLAHNIKINKDLRIIWIDTEQAKFDLKFLLSRALHIAGDLNAFEFFSFRDLDATNEEYIEVLDGVLSKFKCDVIICDNVTDLDSESIMDNTAAHNLTKKLMQLTARYDVALVGVIHENEKAQTGRQGRGHAGSEFVRKCHQIISLEKQGEITSVIFPTSRYLSPEDFEFQVDEQNLPIWNISDKVQSFTAVIQSAMFKSVMVKNGIPNNANNAITQQKTIDLLFICFEQINFAYSKNLIRKQYLPMLETLGIVKNVGAKNKRAYYVPEFVSEVVSTSIDFEPNLTEFYTDEPPPF